MSLEATIMGGIGAVFLFIMASFVATFYKRCPPNQAMIISGMLNSTHRGPYPFKVITGGGGDVIVPVLQQVNYLSLEVMKVNVQAELNAADDVPFRVDATAFMKVRSDEAGIALAATQLLSKSPHEIAEICTAVLLPRLRDLVRSSDSRSLLNSFSDTGTRVREQAEPELTSMGLSCAAFTIERIDQTSSDASSQTVKSSVHSQIL